MIIYVINGCNMDHLWFNKLIINLRIDVVQ